MANDVVDTSSKKNFFEIFGDQVAGPNIIGSLLKFTKYGEWKAGQDESLVPMGTRLIANMYDFRCGWLKWMDNRIAENRLALGREIDSSAVPPPVSRSELGDTDEDMWERFEDGRPKDPWVFTVTLTLMDPDSGELFTYSGQSKGAVNAVGELAKAYGNRIRMYPDEVPTVELGMRTYEHREYGEIRVPKLILVRDGWVALPDALRDAQPESYTDEAAEALVEDAPKALAPPKAHNRTAPKPAPRLTPTPTSKGTKPDHKPAPKSGGRGTGGAKTTVLPRGQKKNGPQRGVRF
jgi:hypothetical protein